MTKREMCHFFQKIQFDLHRLEEIPLIYLCVQKHFYFQRQPFEMYCVHLVRRPISFIFEI